MEHLAEVFGRRLKELRRAKGMTQEELGKAVKLDYKFIGAIERGAKTSSFQTVEKLAAALDVQFYELFIPTALRATAVEKEIADLLANSKRRIDLTKVEDFLRGLRALLRKLDRTEQS
jgi:transcriptional regulator with XRE-family HTH domain